VRHPSVAVVLVVALVACTSGSTGPPSGSPVASSNTAPTALPSVRVAARLRSAPGGCQGADPLVSNVPPWGRLLGGSPAFGAFYARPDLGSGAFLVGSDTSRKRNGWRVKVLWVLEPGTSEPVTLTGEQIPGGGRVLFDPSDGAVSTSMVLDPADPGTPSERKGWTEYPSLLLFPRAGCYRIIATWATGSWTRAFGFGRSRR